MRYYIAYGSNLNTEQMNYRCPTAEKLQTSELDGYRLEFRGSENNAYATILPACKVPVLLWEIQPEDEQKLDRYEGWPRFYRKENLELEIGGQKQEAMVYIMNDGFERDMPSERYLATVMEGYEEAGFDPAPIEMALEMSEWAIAEREGLWEIETEPDFETEPEFEVEQESPAEPEMKM